MIQFKKDSDNLIFENKLTITTICGPMCAGKSAEIISIASRCEAVGQSYICFKPNIDKRVINGIETDNRIVSRKGTLTVGAVTLDINFKLDQELCKIIKEYNTFIFDEAQFFDINSIKEFIAKCTEINQNKQLFFAGLDKASIGKDFETITYLKTISDKILFLTANCSVLGCKSKATITAKIGGKHPSSTVEVGGDDMYKAVCEKHYGEINTL